MRVIAIVAWASLALAVLLAGSGNRATADYAADSLGPLRCYQQATDTQQLEALNAKRLCFGAESDAPARCFAEASRGALHWPELDAVTLCEGATSTGPATCARQLDDETGLDTLQIVSYCATRRYPPVSPGTSDPTCVRRALNRTTLQDAEAARLCHGAQSDGPATCFEWGDNQTTIAERDLVDLCAPYVYGPLYTPWYPGAIPVVPESR